MARPSRLLDLKGQRFERWIVIALSHINEHGKAHWSVRCDCGNEGIVATDQLRRGRSRSCGCLHSEELSARLFKHGQSASNRTGYYNIWNSMLQRCENPKATKFRNYGGRGIKVCDRWHDFMTFYTDIIAEIGPRPEGTTLDRIDNDGNYEPGNVRWATAKEQNNNQRPRGAAQ